MAQYQILYWKHIPAQVRAFRESGRPVSRALPDRFQIEIDRIALEEGLTGSEDYLSYWHWSPKQERPGNAEEVADALIRELAQERKIGPSAGGE